MQWRDVHKASAAEAPNSREVELRLSQGFTVANRVTGFLSLKQIQGCHEITTEGGAVVQWVQGSLSLCEAPSSLHLQLLRINRMVAGTPVILESGFGGKKIRSHPQLHTAFGACLSYMKPSLKSA